jgi:N-acetylmuramoyl-L-alanine amidase
MIPLEFISGVLAPTSREKIDLDDERLVLTVGSPQYNITAIGFEEGEGGTRAVLTLTEELLYHVDSETPGLLRLKIYGGSLNPLKFTIPEEHGLFNRVRAEQTEHDAYLFFDVKRTAARFRVEFEAAGAGAAGERSAGEETSGAGAGRERRLVIFLERGELPEIPEVDYAGKRMLEILDEGPGARRREPLQRIAIDPGHGGIDNGKVGGSGIMEKDVNLEIALLLREQLTEALGVDVVMTRTEDELVPLERRAEIANTEKADLFISIHCNGWFAPKAEGFEVYFLAPARTEEEAQLGRDENASLAYERQNPGGDGSADIDFILWDVVQNEFLNESSDLAEMIQREMSKSLGIRNRGVKQTGLRVLKGLKMPGVLVETAFLSNPREERLLLSTEFRERFVEAVIDAIRKFQSRYEGKG